jgi:hypothetical protein
MKYIRELTVDETKSEWSGSTSGFSMPIASHIEECSEHGKFRVYISGKIVPYHAQ